jgi:hypothetical protein
VACMPHESDKNNSLGTGIGATRRVIWPACPSIKRTIGPP